MSDWDTVTVLKKRAPKASAMKSEQAVNAARRQGGVVETQQKCGYKYIYFKYYLLEQNFIQTLSICFYSILINNRC